MLRYSTGTNVVGENSERRIDMVKKYRKKPVVIEALQYTGDNGFECVKFIGQAGTKEQDGSLSIFTLEGVMKVSKWDWIIKGVEGEMYPCKPDIFGKTYEKVEDEDV